MSGQVLITGAGGYVGPHVVRAVADLGYQPVAVSRRPPEAELDERALFVEADVLAPDFLIESIAPAAEVSAVIHLAWQDGFVHNARSHIESLSAHHGFLAGAAEVGIERIASLGTMHEVGYWEGAVDEDTPTNPVTLYGIAKDALRRSTALTVAPVAEYIWLRAFYILGDDRRNRSIFAKILDAADRGDTEFPFTTGRTLYDFIDVAELGKQIAVASLSNGVTGIVNVCSGKPESLASRVERFIQENDLSIRLRYGAFPDRAYDSPGIWGDSTRIDALMKGSSLGRDTR
ncbi:NAD(P)-dependent oxidoreductase [uncultured Microbacterium sp.]|uniref:NAD-dependent epimerase/dehydratase family protein n=1 Tax=uncultured Microbacterium sp. TaxID=191216 RepID=UPI0025FC7719|nr:NAD(P)-dependent oxidoreductase [uncultured Microbacterium sp.]